MYDLVIVGSGPSGLAAALAAKRRGLDYVVLERGHLADTVYNYPVGKPLFSTSNEVELEEGALPRSAKPTREQVLDHYNEVARREGLNIRTGEEALRILRVESGFTVETNKGQSRSRAVLVAVGGFGRKRRLNAPGEDGLVSYRLSEAQPFAGKKVLVVGGGNSAAESALFLAQAGARVTLSIRRGALDSSGKIKPWVLDPLSRAIADGSILLIASSEVMEIRSRSALVRVARKQASDVVEIECDHIFALIGADPETRLLEEAGAQIAEDGRPVYNTTTYETTVEGLYVAGHVTRELHMKNALAIAKQVAERVASQVLERVKQSDCRH